MAWLSDGAHYAYHASHAMAAVSFVASLKCRMVLKFWCRLTNIHMG